MLGKGVKRKLDQDEDSLEEGRLLLAAAGAPGSHARINYTLQRQTVLNISLMKLYGPPQSPSAEPALQRRVLINNVIRRIHHEFKEEGGAGLRGLFFAVPSPAASSVTEEDEGYREAPSFSGAPSPPDSGLTPASLLEDDPPLFFALPPPSPHPLGYSPRPPAPPAPPPAKDSFSSALEEIEELCPITAATSTGAPAPLSPPPSLEDLSSGMDAKEEGRRSSSNDKDSLSQDGGQAAKPSAAELLRPPCSPTDMSPSSGGFLTDFALDDILFTDIDTSMYDFNPPCGASLLPPNSGSSKTTPVVTADDLVKTLSSYSGGGAGSHFLAQSQPFKMDLAELDHIMEVLVGS
ncbi:SERTA domain-containing protein 2 [Esox lucius]|nr:SERTA domain-containing protein 2 [Esox lucius]